MPQWLIFRVQLMIIILIVCLPKTINHTVVEKVSPNNIIHKHTENLTPLVSKAYPSQLVKHSDSGIYKNTTSTKRKKDISSLTKVDLSTITTTDASRSKEIPGSDSSIAYKVVTVKKTKWLISLTFDNDIFANRDYYYTNGIRLELSPPFAKNSPINKILIGTKNKDIRFSGFSIVQNIYTPTNPEAETILYGDHPFSSYLTVGLFQETFDLIRKLRIKSEINIGVLGPSSFGRQVQSSIHETEPVGWQNQVNNDFVLDYSIRIDKGFIDSPIFELNAVGSASIGTLYNKAGGGFNMRFGNFLPVYHGPSSIFENTNPGGRYQFWIFSETLIDFIGYDATLQGGIFSGNNPYVIEGSDVNRVVIQASVGLAVYYNNIGIEYEHFYLSPRFKGAYDFGWGRLKAVFAF